MDERILVAMSGGVDSAVSLAILKEQYKEICGITLRLNPVNLASKIGEDGLTDEERDAQSVANMLGVKHIVADATKEFREHVICPFIETYRNGGTPNPCIDCNRHLKFPLVIAKMKEMGFDRIATGHYARVEYDAGKDRYLLKKALYEDKDQAYVLYNMTQEELSHVVFPLGELNKESVREIASRQELAVSHKKDSQDICFIDDGDYVSFIGNAISDEEITGDRYNAVSAGDIFVPGDFVDAGGNVLGKHKGLACYTIGQRKGMGLSLKEPMYVVKKDCENNRVILGRNDNLFTDTLKAANVNWIAFDNPSGEIRCTARTRYKQKETPATVVIKDGGNVEVKFDEPIRGITAGQSVVFYDGEYVLGGGVICR